LIAEADLDLSAGGKDAIFAIVIGEENVAKVEELWKRKGVVSLGIEEVSVGARCDQRISKILSLYRTQLD
jgi:hypothetical protein